MDLKTRFSNNRRFLTALEKGNAFFKRFVGIEDKHIRGAIISDRCTQDVAFLQVKGVEVDVNLVGRRQNTHLEFVDAFGADVPGDGAAGRIKGSQGRDGG